MDSARDTAAGSQLPAATLLERTVALCASLPRTITDLRTLLGRGRSETYRQVARGVDLGLLQRVAPLRGVPALILATEEGHRWVRSGLAVARISPGGTVHAVICSAAATRLAGSRSGRRLISEAELRRDEAITGLPIASAVLGEYGDGRPRLHRPDLVLLGDRRPVAIEVELSPKAPSRLLEICRGWRRARHLEEVVYMCAPGTTRRAVEAAIGKAHAGERVRVTSAEGLP